MGDYYSSHPAASASSAYVPPSYQTQDGYQQNYHYGGAQNHSDPYLQPQASYSQTHQLAPYNPAAYAAAERRSSEAYRPPYNQSSSYDERDRSYSERPRSRRHHSHDGRSERGDGDGGSERAHKHKKDHSVQKSIGAALAGAAGGGLLGHEIGGGPLATLGGIIAGAVGAGALESKHEKHKKEREHENNSGSSHGGHHHRRHSSYSRSGRESTVDGAYAGRSDNGYLLPGGYSGRDGYGGSDNGNSHGHRKHRHHSRSRSRGGD